MEGGGVCHQSRYFWGTELRPGPSQCIRKSSEYPWAHFTALCRYPYVAVETMILYRSGTRPNRTALFTFKGCDMVDQHVQFPQILRFESVCIKAHVVSSPCQPKVFKTTLTVAYLYLLLILPTVSIYYKTGFIAVLLLWFLLFHVFVLSFCVVCIFKY